MFNVFYTEQKRMIIRIKTSENSVTQIACDHVTSTKRTQNSEEYGGTHNLYVYTIDGREHCFSSKQDGEIDALQHHIMGRISE